MRWQVIRRALERVLTVGLVLGPIAVIVLWLTLHHIPSWYRPALLDETGTQRARSEAVSVTDYISDQMVKQKAFEVTLSDKSLTQWLAALPSIWPTAHERLPPQIRDIAVGFDRNVVRIGARYDGSVLTIVSIHLALDIIENGTQLSVRMLHVRSGSLPFPIAILDRMLADRLSTVDSPAAHKIESLSDLVEGVQFENRFVWFNGRRPFRIESLEVTAGEVRLRLQPL